MNKIPIKQKIFELLANAINPAFTELKTKLTEGDKGLKLEVIEHFWREKIDSMPKIQLQNCAFPIADAILHIQDSTYLIVCEAKIRTEEDIQVTFSIGQKGCSVKLRPIYFDDIAEIDSKHIIENIRFSINELEKKCVI